MLRGVGIAIVAGLSVCCPSWAANITGSVSSEGKMIVVLQGDIAEGDSETLRQIIKSANASGRLVAGIRLNSNGGSLAEGVRLADIIRYAKMTTVVQNGATCASACFVAFAAGSEKYANYSAQIGVHGASDSAGRETAGSGAATVVMARVVKDLGVPPSIIGKMVVTPPSEMVWLSPDELRAMGVTMAGKPAQVAPESAQLPPRTSQIPPATQAKLPTWEELVNMAIAISKRQNGGTAATTRVCQPEIKSCTVGVFYKDTKGVDTIVRRTEDLAGQTLSREVCDFNSFGDIRNCFDWDKKSLSVQMKNSKGQWIEVDRK